MTGKSRRGYHHGNLREALIEATLELVVEKGPLGFTLAEAARAAGVSAAAPYRHFTGREELLEAGAIEGYVIFADLMEKAYNNGKPSDLAAFEAVGRAYLAFARSHPGHYIAMFESGVQISGNAQLSRVSDRAMGILTDAAAKLTQHISADRRPPASMVAHHIWALAHGVVELFARGDPGARAPFSPDELLESGTGIYLRGLGILPKE